MLSKLANDAQLSKYKAKYDPIGGNYYDLTAMSAKQRKQSARAMWLT